MKKLVHATLLIASVLVGGSRAAAAADDPNTLTAEEKQAGFESLFNGRDLSGWEHKGNWKIEDGAIFRAEKAGGLVYKALPIPDDFELRFQWKVGKGSNSGVYYRPGQYEYQILDNQVHRDGQNPRTSAASLYFCMAPSRDATRPVGQWNDGRVVCKGTVVQHWLNGEKVIDLDYADPKYAKNVELLGLRGGDLAGRGAFLSLQDHGDPVWYRGIKLRTLSAADQLDRTPVTPAAIPEEALKHEQETLQRLQAQRQKQKQGPKPGAKPGAKPAGKPGAKPSPKPADKAAEEVETDPLVLKKLQWFQDQKFGFFMHWGMYSQWGSIESWPLVEVERWARPDDLKPWVERGRDFPRFFRDYQALNTTFNPQRFEPARFAAAAKAAGMKYVVFTTKHHDGFSMFDTKQTEYRTTHPSCPFHANPRADAVKAVFDAFRQEGFGIGVYFSKADWHHPDYWDLTRPHASRNVNYDTAQESEKWQRFVRFTHAQIEELMTGYGPVDILWLDAGQVRPPKQDIDMPRLAAMARRHQPGLIVVDRTVRGRYENYRTPEQQVPAKALPYVWETCMTMGDQWSFKPDDRYKSTHRLVHLLVDIVAKGGNFLLNVGPDSNGELPPTAVGRMGEIGAWMRVNGDAIYGTRAVAPFKVGNVCLTQKKDKLYLIALGEEGQAGPTAEIKMPALKSVKSVRMLGAAQPVTWTVDEKQGLTIRVPQSIQTAPPCQHAWALEVDGGVLAVDGK